MTPQTCRAAVLRSPERIEIEERPIPGPGPGEALIRVRYAGICGTDLALFSGDYATQLPLVPGHEFAGEIAAVGEGVDAQLVGSHVTGEINVTCLSVGDEEPCQACLRGMPNHCSRRTVVGISGRDGAFQEYLLLPARNLHVLPAELPLHHGVLVEPLAAAIQTFELAEITPGDAVVVLGAGRLGVLICKVASLKGARVAAVSHSPYKLQLAKKYGAQALLEAGGDIRQQVMDLTDGLGADIVVECTGSAGSLEQALDLVRPRGTVCLKSTPGDAMPPFPLTSAVVNEVRVQCSRCGPFGKAIRMMLRHGLAMDALISERFPLNNVRTALQAARTKYRVIIEC